MSFIWAHLLWLLFLVPALIGVYVLLQRRRRKYALRYSSLSLVKEALGRGPGWRRHIPPLLFLIALVTMTLALARPAATITLPSQQATVILTFDISGSMRADDVQPTRMEAAKAAARAFVEKQPREVRIGVVSFSESASILQSPTIDRDAVQSAIGRLGPQRRTAIGSGIRTSLEAIFEESGPKPANPRDPLASAEPEPAPPPLPPGTFAPAVIVLLSDGASNTGPLPLDVAEEAAERGVRIYAVGLGSADGTILRADGFSIRVRLDEETLKRIAQTTYGQYYKADSDTDLVSIYENLSTRLVFHTEKTELTALFTAFAGVLLLAAGTLSMLWFNRLP
ncbi:MAG: VWA domain-containing protein [Chloroflexi bacterium]|nr:VWA domain-containing protein [Chloroflexota bacterium]